MEFDKLWAPWRIGYITNPKCEGCFLCRYPSESDDKKNLILQRGKSAFVIMNFYPYNNGHLMVAPYQHTNDFAALDDATHLELFHLVEKSVGILRETLKAEGFNIGVNLGTVAGAGLKDHLHIHIVPRWTGDTNFMPVIGHTKVISEGLTETWQKLKSKFDE
ncbi:MAG TPA: HIT domain-containing protein [Candidatus Marinimicrobia bacterium]|mgnify:FL=1|nr:HIT domain-containing protein [Candidatus Neomarinimicrobiota bacterium]OQC44622.1 MAG: AP-4-A phosphorylase [Candidatus Marinimicrobia bacterium ADurb.Bin030]HOD37696.1 HIT domain-containing protein [Candidatus Neomarinimicrobiota bacterium]HOU16340.1 HIT domain-containing protein [Candidatus Neomarinimicrobiota bacterium]HOV23007.1 HIT domain-containing protein [Candidatus Neomarinimicrobiota bacterium]